MRIRFAIVVLTALTVGVGVGPRAATQKPAGIEQYLSPAYPFELATAAKAERLRDAG